MATGKLFGDLRCSHCTAVADGYTTLDDKTAMPKDGDFSICVYCLSLNVYVSNPFTGMRLRAATVAEAAECQRRLK